ncbi:MAG: CRISPR-associated endonuclease Cas2 [Acidobacteria bacterium]|nr:CRISPR-associated endonuclease Cas2 [Acidobacteriota bacterium]
MEELQTLVIYDIEEDARRLRISETCLDYGLERIQYSAFRGRLNRNRREELFAKLCAILGDRPGRVIVQPLCDKDRKELREKENPGLGKKKPRATFALREGP